MLRPKKKKLYFHYSYGAAFDIGRAIMTGLVLEANGKRLIRQGKYKDALEVLSMAEVSS